MNDKNQELREMLNLMPKMELGFLPTPIHHLKRLSEIMGVKIYMKRDDYAGIGQFGGNKVRKLNYLMADAVKNHADTVITYGASQSNHAMQTAQACNRMGIKPILYLVDLLEGEEEPKANMILNKILGAEIILEPALGDTFSEGLKRCRAKAKVKMNKLKEKGHHCYEIPMGGANAIGTMGFIEGFLEMKEQTEELEIHVEHIYHPSGSGGTLAGLAAGKKLTDSPVFIHGVGVGISHDRYDEEVSDLANEALKNLGSTLRVTPGDFQFHGEYGGEGYEMPTLEAEDAMRLLAQVEGIFLDPVYTAKAFSGMIDQIRSGVIKSGSTVLFWHTGGLQALFAEKEILGHLI